MNPPSPKNANIAAATAMAPDPAIALFFTAPAPSALVRSPPLLISFTLPAPLRRAPP